MLLPKDQDILRLEDTGRRIWRLVEIANEAPGLISGVRLGRLAEEYFNLHQRLREAAPEGFRMPAHCMMGPSFTRRRSWETPEHDRRVALDDKCLDTELTIRFSEWSDPVAAEICRKYKL